MKEQNTKKHLRNDLLLIAGLLLAAALGILYLFVFRSTGDTVKVTVDGKPYATYSLSQNITKDIYTGKNNEHLNRLVIQDGKAFVETATCPDGICVAHSAVFRDGESIVCLPHGVVIAVVTQGENGPDIVL